MLGGPGLTPRKIRAERSSNLSFQKLRSAGLFCISVTLRPQVLQPGPAVRTRSGVEGLFEILSGYHFSFSDHVDLDYD